MENIVPWQAAYIETNITAEGDCKRFSKGDILFGKLRPYLAKAYLPKQDGVCSGEFLVLRNFNGCLSYLKYVLMSYDLIMLINASTYGAKMPRANWDFIGSCLIPIPPLSEQKVIVRYLDERSTKIDNLISSAKNQINLLHEYRARLISDVVTGKVDVRKVRVPDFAQENEAEPAAGYGLPDSRLEESGEETDV
jgi:type I restriction enzyme S subunit